MKKFIVLSILLLSLLLAGSGVKAAVGKPYKPLVVTMNGVNVTLDWSAMQSAGSYTLYYAFGNYLGEMIPATIGSIEMGNRQTLYVPGLPSGLIIFAAVVAHQDSGDVTSNIETFAGFAGSVSMPTDGETLLQIQDPGGVGNWDVSGTRNAQDGSFRISKVVVDSDAGPQVITISNDRPTGITTAGKTALIVYHDGQPTGFQAAGNHRDMQPTDFRISGNRLTAAGISNDDLCTTFEDKAAYEKALRTRGNSYYETAVDRFLEATDKEGIPHDIQTFYLASEIGPPTITALTFKFATENYSTLSQKNRAELAVILGKVKAYFQLIFMAVDGMYDGVIQQMSAAYDTQCDNGGLYDDGVYVHTWDGDVFLSTECPIPPGAKAVGDYRTEYYMLNHRAVGPQNSWQDAEHSHRFQTFCRDAHGVKQGWFITYNSHDTSKVRTAIKFVDGHNVLEYEFSANNGNLGYKVIRNQDGETIESFRYDDTSGKLLRHCDQQGCTNH